MAYRKDYLHRDGRPPPPYSKHKQGAGAANSATSSTPSDSKFTTELFRDMSKKIAQLTKVICNLTNKVEDQELLIQSLKKEHQKQVNALQSETRDKILGYRTKVEGLEARLREEKRKTSEKEEEFLTLKQFCNFSENFKLFKKSLKVRASINGEPKQDELEMCRAVLTPERHPISVYLNSHQASQTALTRNGCNEITFIGHKLRDMESYQEEVRTLIDDCEKLKAEKRALQTKYESELQDMRAKQHCGDEKHCIASTVNPDLNLKEKAEKQELQYRTRISELLRHLSQSENRAEKCTKEIKQLETSISLKEKQVSAVKEELSKAVEVLQQSREENSQVHKFCVKQTKEIQERKDHLTKLEDEAKRFNVELLNSKSTIEELLSKLEDFEKISQNLSQILDENQAALNENNIKSEWETIPEHGKDLNETNIETQNGNIKMENNNILEAKLNSLIKSFKEQENLLVEKLEETKLSYEHHMTEERLVHTEIQDNLEQQLDLLHSNLQQMMRCESDELNSLRASVAEKGELLQETIEALKNAEGVTEDLEQKLKERDAYFAEFKENIKLTQKLNLVEKLQDAMTKCLQNKDSFICNNETKHVISKIQEGERSNQDYLVKLESLTKKIEVLEHTKDVLLKEKENMKQTHQAELIAQSEAHKVDIQKLTLNIEGKYKGERQILFKKHHKDSIAVINDEKNEAQRNIIDVESQDFHKEAIEILEHKLMQLQQEVNKREEAFNKAKIQLLSVSTKQKQINYLEGIVLKLKQENDLLIMEQEKKINEALKVRHEASQQVRNLESYWQERLVRELKKVSRTFEQEKQKLTSSFSKGQRLLKDKICVLQSIIQNLKLHSVKEQSLVEDTKEKKELRRIISEKESMIKKLQDEKETLHTELIACNSNKLNESQLFLSNIETVISLKKPRLERPPLTPQLIRRHSLVGNSEQKWLRARSQSPLHGILSETTVRSSFSKFPIHRASWTGESLEDLIKNSESMVETMNSYSPNCGVQNKIGSVLTEDVQTNQAPTNNEFKPKIFTLGNSDLRISQESISSHLCDMIAECDEHHPSQEEKQNTLQNKKLDEFIMADFQGLKMIESEL